MKILILSFYYQPDLCAGSFRCTALVDELKEMVGPDDDIDVLTTMPNRYSSFNATALKVEQQKRVTIRRIVLAPHHSSVIYQVKGFLRFAQEIHNLTKSTDYDLVFATSGRLMTAVLGAWVARKKKTKLYLDIRDIFVDTINDIFSTKLTHIVKPIFSLLEQWAFRRADRINVVSKGFYSYFGALALSEKLRCFTNGVDDMFITHIPNISIPVEHISFKPLTVLYAGNIGEGPGLHRIIPQLAKYYESSLCFKVIGDGGRQPLLVEKLKEIGCSNVELLPPVSRSELIKEYERADILFLHLNDYAVFHNVLPSKLFEYAATGKYIWAGVSGYAAEFIRTEITTNVAIFDPCNVAHAIETFKMIVPRHVGREIFIKKFSRNSIMHAMVTDMLSLIRD